MAVNLSKGGMTWLTFTAFFFLAISWLLGAWVAQLHREEQLSRNQIAFLPYL